MAMTEQESAELSKRRGEAAAQITDPEKRRKFIAAQGDYETNKDASVFSKMSNMMTPTKLDSEATAVQASGGKEGLKSYKKGTDRVPKTGAYKLHEDEAVLNKAKAEKYRAVGLAEGPLAHGEAHDAKPKKAKKEVKAVHVRKAKNGGMIAENHHENPAINPMEEHTLPDMSALHDHMDQFMGQGSDQSEQGSSEASE